MVRANDTELLCVQELNVIVTIITTSPPHLLSLLVLKIWLKVV